jgi:hypothetical protein
MNNDRASFRAVAYRLEGGTYEEVISTHYFDALFSRLGYLSVKFQSMGGSSYVWLHSLDDGTLLGYLCSNCDGGWKFTAVTN